MNELVGWIWQVWVGLNGAIESGMALIELVVMIAWLAYVRITHRTLVEIRTQTQNQTRGRLNADPKLQVRTDKPSLPEEPLIAHGAYRSQLEKWLPDAVVDGEYVVVTLENFGQSPILSVTVSVRGEILPGAYLESKAVGPRDLCWRIEITRPIRPGETAEVVVAQVGCFPMSSLSFEYQYSDVVGAQGAPASGPRDFKHQNALAVNKRLGE